MRRPFVVSIVCMLAASLAACGDADAPAGTSPSLGVGGNGVVAGATGGGVVTLPPGFGDLQHAFTAHAFGDGRVTGRFRQHRERNGFVVEFTGEVTCVTVDAPNHRAWVGGVVLENRSTDPAFQTAIHQPGQDVWFRVLDNGEGSDDLPDRSTVLGFKGAGGIDTSAQYCAVQPWLAGDANTFPVAGGNIQVKAW